MNNVPTFSMSPGAVALTASAVAAIVGLAAYAAGTAPAVVPAQNVGVYCPELGAFVKSEQV